VSTSRNIEKQRRAGQLDLPLEFRAREAVGRAHLALEGKLVTYTVKRSLRRRAISIMVDEEGLRVGAPWDASERAIERLIHKHSEWVLRKLDEWNVRRAPARRWQDGEPLMLLGMPHVLKVVPTANAPRVQGNVVIIGMPDDAATSVSRQVLDWLRDEAITCYRERVEHYRRLLQVDAPHVLLSSARTRWGSCHSSGRIHLNWRLIQMPLRLIDYVVAHEVAHLLEMNHSQRFWRTVARVVPDYAERRAEIRRDAHRYLLV
jgi:predicted metal-dependent hydrolase